MREYARDKKAYPLWLRMAFAAMANAGKNGHANFMPGELQSLLGTSRDEITRAMPKTVAHGWLDPGSLTTDHRCLILAANRFRGYDARTATAPCKLCGT